MRGQFTASGETSANAGGPVNQPPSLHGADVAALDTFCPYCFAHVVGVKGRPRYGDLAVCPNCQEVSVFSQTKRLRKPMDHEVKGIAANARCQAIRNEISQRVQGQNGSDGNG